MLFWITKHFLIRIAAQSRNLHLSRLDQKSKTGISDHDNLGSSF
ncbi:hypothetical protein HMPREF9104_02770 [Lentilactobacillus kisonensis F0435]|uniref:Uncharacterized protein n=1 Tax=Lentilactobacillus kisonensis F0435 TaxID=797516 RepID=H1LJH8_9LACO|nr:hypothetical protein HMPREF9104_02770 [Lentilactobacillus kisonensis F0435]